MKHAQENFVIIHLSDRAVYTVIACRSACGQFIEVIAIGDAKTDAFMQGQLTRPDKLILALKTSVNRAETMANMRIESALFCFGTPQMHSTNAEGRVDTEYSEPISSFDMVEALENAKQSFMQSTHYLSQFELQLIWLDDNKNPVKSAIGVTGVQTLYARYHLMSVPQILVKNLYNALRQHSVGVDALLFDGVAKATYALMENEKERGVLFVDIGHSATNVCIYFGDVLIFTACIGLGVDDITNAIADRWSLSYNEAVRLRRHSATLAPKAQDTQNFDSTSEGGVILKSHLSAVVQQGYDEIFDEIDRIQLEQGLAQLPLQVMVIAGEGSQIKDVIAYLKKRYRLPVYLTNRNPKIVISKKQKKDEHIVALGQMIAQPSLQTALGAMIYHANEDIRHQKRVHTDDFEDDESSLQKLWKRWVGWIDKRF